MSGEDIETLRGLYEAFGRRDYDRVLDSVHPDVVLRPGIEGLDTSRRYHGHVGLRQFWKEIGEAWETQTVEPVEMVEAEGDRVLAVERWHVRGRDGIELEFGVTDVYTFRDGLVVRIDGFVDKTKALEAVGLSE